MLKVAPSILSADFGRLAEEVASVEREGADWVHLDVMDGRFVPNITIGPPVIESLRAASKLFFDAHLMILEPERQIKAFADAGCDSITVHQEATTHLHRTLAAIRDLDCKAGVSLNPSTPVGVLEDLLDSIDMVLVMTVNPGFGGQAFIEACVPKVRKVKEMAAKLRSKDLDPLEIQVDGGINADTARLVEKAGATVAVAGSAIFDSDDYGAVIRGIRGQQRSLVER